MLHKVNSVWCSIQTRFSFLLRDVGTARATGSVLHVHWRSLMQQWRTYHKGKTVDLGKERFREKKLEVVCANTQDWQESESTKHLLKSGFGWIFFSGFVKSVSKRNNRLEKTISCKLPTTKWRLKLRRILKSLSMSPPKTEAPWHYGENSKAFSINSHKPMQKTDRYWEVCLRAAGTLAYVCQPPNIPPSLMLQREEKEPQPIHK